MSPDWERWFDSQRAMAANQRDTWGGLAASRFKRAAKFVDEVRQEGASRLTAEDLRDCIANLTSCLEAVAERDAAIGKLDAFTNAERVTREESP